MEMPDDQRKHRIAELDRQIKERSELLYELKKTCPHTIVADKYDSAVCITCDEDFGWWCPKSPDNACHYHTCAGGTLVQLITGKTVDPPLGHVPRRETSDHCIYCGNPEERK